MERHCIFYIKAFFLERFVFVECGYWILYFLNRLYSKNKKRNEWSFCRSFHYMTGSNIVPIIVDLSSGRHSTFYQWELAETVRIEIVFLFFFFPEDPRLKSGNSKICSFQCYGIPMSQTATFLVENLLTYSISLKAS